mmetsp:Transcript_73652/g.204777  ORF Transcript_73652/g.204777 Transcript_73652/m.204777 type:complete len:111 (-) Transcript_73652:562-894(-)
MARIPVSVRVGTASMKVAADEHAAILQAEVRRIREASDPVKAELDFWKEKAQGMIEAHGLYEIPEELQRAAERRAKEAVRSSRVATKTRHRVPLSWPRSAPSSRRKRSTI